MSFLRISGGRTFKYTLYLPLWNGVESLEIGVEPILRFINIPFFTGIGKKPIVF